MPVARQLLRLFVMGGHIVDEEMRTLLQRMESHMDSIRWKVGFLFWAFLVGGILVAGGFVFSVIATYTAFGVGPGG